MGNPAQFDPWKSRPVKEQLNIISAIRQFKFLTSSACIVKIFIHMWLPSPDSWCRNGSFRSAVLSHIHCGQKVYLFIFWI